MATTLTGNAEIQINVSGEALLHNRRECLLESLLKDADYGPSWLLLAKGVRMGETVDVNGTAMSKQQCYLRAVQTRSKDANAWVGLGVTVSVRDGGVVHVPATAAGDAPRRAVGPPGAPPATAASRGESPETPASAVVNGSFSGGPLSG